VLALTFLIATGSSTLFGTSIALGAFLAGMSASQTPFRHRVLIAATPLKDTFIVIFFLSVGMMFNPIVIYNRFGLFLIILGVILIIKPLLAFIITVLLKFPVRIGWTVAIALAQIGEFSFVMAEQAMKYKIMPEEGYDLLVACALLSLSINPSLFKLAIMKKGRALTQGSTG
jgi:CPA2 family monovalent cation:H+ antiporter-2